MIYGYLNEGSGLGNQIFRYIATRVKALDLGVDYRLVWNPDGSGKGTGFKGSSFLPFDNSKIIFSVPEKVSFFTEKKSVENGIDIRGYDPEFNFIEDETLIEGEFQDERYFSHKLTEVNEWLSPTLPEPDFKQNRCVIAHRGGEYALYPELYLTHDYWVSAVLEILKVCPDAEFHVVTDDVHEARKMFPDFSIYHEISHDWLSIRYAPYLILSNSSFGIFPALLNGNAKKIIAPRYWSRKNLGVWSLPQNYYSKFSYI